MTMALPITFQHSVLDSINYPQNIVSSGITAYRSTLEAYKKRLDDAEARLCLFSEKQIKDDFEVPIRDLQTAMGEALAKKNIHTPEGLTEWLGLSSSADPGNPAKRVVAAKKKEPKSRFIYLFAEHSRDRLKITRRSLAEILTFYQVMPVYLDFMLVFGAQSDAKDLRFSGFREQTMMRDPPRTAAIPELGRSGRQFKLCYNLKGVTLKKEDNENLKLNEWSIRQAAVYHQFDVVFGTTLWIVTKGRRDILDRYKELTGPNARPEDGSFGNLEECFRSSLAAHLLYCHWSTEDWRWYIRWLEEVIEAETAMAVYGPRGPGYAHKEYKPYHIQDLQYWQDKSKEAIMILEANIDVINAIKSFYMNLRDQRDFPKDLASACDEDLSSFSAHLGEVTADFKMQMSRARLLASIISDRKELVLQHLQGQAAERTEQLNMNLEKEAIVMRIITLVTLLYLPATFVSTFFSTDVVKYQNEDGGALASGTFSSVAMTRWLQVTIPLTAVTLFLAWSTWKYAETARQRPKKPTHYQQNDHQQPSGAAPTQQLAPTGHPSSRQNVKQPWWLSVQRIRASISQPSTGLAEKKSASLPLYNSSG